MNFCYLNVHTTCKDVYFCLIIVRSACRDPGGISNGYGTSNNTDSSQFPIWTVVTFQCNTGYKLVGSRQRQCRADGNWSERQNPTCEGKKHDYNTLPFAFKDDFQSVLRTLEGLFTFFCFVSCKTSRNINISQLLT